MNNKIVEIASFAVLTESIITYFKEFFVSGVYNEMVKKNMCIDTFKTDLHISFGTPEEFDEALHQKALFEVFRSGV